MKATRVLLFLMASLMTAVSCSNGKPDVPGPEDPETPETDHPFAFVTGEASSGTILFEGVFSGK